MNQYYVKIARPNKIKLEILKLRVEFLDGLALFSKLVSFDSS